MPHRGGRLRPRRGRNRRPGSAPPRARQGRRAARGRRRAVAGCRAVRQPPSVRARRRAPWGTTERPRRRGQGWACSLRGSLQPSSQAESHRARRTAVARQESRRPRPFVRPYDTLVGEWIKESGEIDEQLFVPALGIPSQERTHTEVSLRGLRAWLLLESNSEEELVKRIVTIAWLCERCGGAGTGGQHA